MTELTPLVLTNVVKQEMEREESRSRKRSSAYWWSKQIETLRDKLQKSSRKKQRLRITGEQEYEAAALVYIEDRRSLNRAIRTAKRNCWRVLCEELDNDPWGQAYKIITKRFGRRLPILSKSQAEQEISELFPCTEEVIEGIINCDSRRFTLGELNAAVGHLGNKKSPGLDGIPAALLKGLVRRVPWEMLEITSQGLENRNFPACWKEARIVFLQKGPKENGDISYRPLSLLNTLGKVVEKMLASRIIREVEEGVGISNNQFGFWKGRSTIHAIQKVMDWALETRRGTWRTRRIPLFITLDIKNAFGTIRWSSIIEAMAQKNISPYLQRQIREYLSDRRCQVEAQEEILRFDLYGGVPQGSILGPLLWVLAFDGILQMRYPCGVQVLAYADDLAITVEGKTINEVQEKANITLGIISSWVAERGLEIAMDKSRFLMFTGKRQLESPLITLNGQAIAEAHSVKYLGITLDKSCRFTQHIINVCNKAEIMTKSLNVIMSNKRAPRPSKRRVIASTVVSSILYAVPVWWPSVEIKRNLRRLTGVHRRLLLGVVSAYRTVSYEALCVLSGVPPIDLMALSRVERMQGIEVQETKNRLRTRWQNRWRVQGTAKRTKDLIPDLFRWLDRRFGEVDFYLTQFFTGHGNFNEYLCRIGRRPEPGCMYCGIEDSAEHTFFECGKWRTLRATSGIDGKSPIEVFRYMMVNENNWRKVADFARGVISQKDADERTLGF